MKDIDISILAEKNMDNYTPSQFRMATENLKGLVLEYSVPTILGMLINALYNVVDRFWIGKLPGVGALSLTGVGVVMPVMNIIMGCAQLVGIGAAANISIHLGRSDKLSAEKVLNGALMLSVLFSLVISSLGIVFAPNLLRLVGASNEIMPYALSYGRIIIGMCVFQLVSFSMNHCIRATGNPKRFASTQFLGAAVNMVLDPIFIFVFDMGVAGVAIATVISQFVASVWIFSFYLKPSSELKFKLHFMRLDPKIIASVFSIGLSPFLMQVSGALVNSILNNTLYRYGNIEYNFGGGDLAIGAMALIDTILMLLFMPVIGINQGVQPIIGFNYGRKDYGRAKAAFGWACTYGVALCTFGWAAVLLFAHQLVGFFNTDPLLMEITTVGMKIYLFGLPIVAFQAQSTNFFTAIGRAKMSILLSALRQIILLIPLYIVLPQFFGLTGIWYAGPISGFTSAAFSAICIIREFKMINKKAREEVTALGFAPGEQ